MYKEINDSISSFRYILTKYVRGGDLTEQEWDKLRDMTIISIKELQEKQPKA